MGRLCVTKRYKSVDFNNQTASVIVLFRSETATIFHFMTVLEVLEEINKYKRQFLYVKTLVYISFRLIYVAIYEIHRTLFIAKGK